MTTKRTHIRFYRDPTPEVARFLATAPQDRWRHSEVIELIGPTNWAGLKKLEGRIPDEDLLSEACWAAKRNALNAA
jgi:hypothetical protein